MTPGPPFAREMRWKRRVGILLVLAGCAGAGTAMLGLGGEVINGIDAVTWVIEGLMAAGGFGLLLSPDPAQL